MLLFHFGCKYPTLQVGARKWYIQTETNGSGAVCDGQ